jgi:hypothetical protein
MATIIKPSEVPKYVPGVVTAASDDLGWNGVGYAAIAIQAWMSSCLRRGTSQLYRTAEGPPSWSGGTREHGLRRIDAGRCFAVDKVTAFAF